MGSSLIGYVSIALALSFLALQNVEGGFTVNGRFQSDNLQIHIGGTLEVNGELIGHNSATIYCRAVAGKGLIQSPSIFLQTQEFAFTGTVHCEGVCTIIAKVPFDETGFKRSGNGEFIVLIDPNIEQELIQDGHILID